MTIPLRLDSLTSVTLPEGFPRAKRASSSASSQVAALYQIRTLTYFLISLRQLVNNGICLIGSKSKTLHRGGLPGLGLGPLKGIFDTSYVSAKHGKLGLGWMSRDTFETKHAHLDKTNSLLLKRTLDSEKLRE